MDVMEKSNETDVYHERDKRAFTNYQMRDYDQIKRLVDKSKARVFVIKALCELQNLAELMSIFRPAKTIWIVRNYIDVVNSALRSFGNQSEQVKRIAKDRGSSGWLAAGMSDETHTAIKEMVSDTLDDGTAAALQWYLRNILFFEQNFNDDERVLLVEYERLVSKPEEEFRRVFEFVGLNYTPNFSINVSPRSIGKYPAPEIASTAQKLCDGLLERFYLLLDNVR